MGYLPQVSGARLLKALEKMGYSIVSQKGIHIKAAFECKKGKHTIIIPNHKTISKGTLNDIINKVSLWADKSKEEIIDMLK
ncbi:MAG: type II toxin-antitoxin system HicA family toxin [Spirochaetales bacterium]|nr:type II toxin-antitoxin system HicA family toxin [Spirochaetales bacterium]